jgi:hypothetical protein
MQFHLKGSERDDESTMWLPIPPYQALDLINNSIRTSHRKEWILRVDGIEKNLKEWLKDGISIDIQTFVETLSE